MKVGTVKEIKNNENRVGMTPKNVSELVSKGHECYVEKSAGNNAGFSDEEYTEAGATILDNAVDVAKEVEILVKVKEPIAAEFDILEALAGKSLFTYLHLAAAPKELTEKLMEYNITSIAYETVEDENGRLPLLTPMSEVAGVLAVQYGAQYLQKKYGGRGKTLGHITNADPAHVVVVGGGVVGSKSALTAAGMGGRVTILEKSVERIAELKKIFSDDLGSNLYSNVSFVESTPDTLSKALSDADLLVGAVLVPGAKAPRVVSEEDVQAMRNGSVIVDVAIDQGGCIAGSKPTTHEDPIYDHLEKIYCCITNMPGQAPLQSTQALTQATFPYLMNMVENGVEVAMENDAGLKKGLNVYKGKVVYKEVAEALGL